MKRFGFVLALLVLFGTLAVIPVKAEVYSDYRVIWSGSVSFDTPVNVSSANLVTHGMRLRVNIQTTSHKFAFALYLFSNDSTYYKQIVTEDAGDTVRLDGNRWGKNINTGVDWPAGEHYIVFDFLPNGTLNIYIDGKDSPVKTVNNVEIREITKIELKKEGGQDSSWYSTVNLLAVAVSYIYYDIALNVRDALTGQGLSGVTIKDNGKVLGTFSDGEHFNLTYGTHTLTFEKSGYWSVTKTIDVQGDMSISVEMYPSSAAFKLENFPTNISIPENTIYELTFTLSPIDTSATYNTYLSLSGLSDILEVQKDGSAISAENGKYYLGDISSPVQVSIKFKAGAVGQHGFTISLESHDAIMSKTYTTTKQVVYQVEPFALQRPDAFGMAGGHE